MFLARPVLMSSRSKGPDETVDLVDVLEAGEDVAPDRLPLDLLEQPLAGDLRLRGRAAQVVGQDDHPEEGEEEGRAKNIQIGVMPPDWSATSSLRRFRLSRVEEDGKEGAADGEDLDEHLRDLQEIEADDEEEVDLVVEEIVHVAVENRPMTQMRVQAARQMKESLRQAHEQVAKENHHDSVSPAA